MWDAISIALQKRFLQRPVIAVDLLSDVTDYGLIQLFEGK